MSSRLVEMIKKQNIKLDNFDLAILRVLQKDNSVPHRVIADTVNISAPSVQRRIKRLNEAGVIESNVSVISGESVGYPLTIIALVELSTDTMEEMDHARKAFLNAPEVQQCFYVTGTLDFVMVIIVRSMSEYEELTRRLFYKNNNVKKFNTHVCMDQVKAGMHLPI